MKKKRKQNLNKFTIDFGDPWAGWLGAGIEHKGKCILSLSISYAFNPFYDYVNILHDLKHTKKRKFTLIIDEEGYYSEIEIINVGKKLRITTRKLCNPKSQYWMPEYKTIVNKSDFIYEFKNKLLDCVNRNKKEMLIGWFSFPLDLKKLERI